MEDLYYDRRNNLTNLIPLTDKMMQVNFEAEENLQKVDRKHNCVLSSFVTSLSRIVMHQEMTKLQNQEGAICIYSDTDSIVFAKRRVQPIRCIIDASSYFT